MGLHNLKPAKGANRNKKRVGRGPGCHGKTAGRGNKGQKSRSGYSQRLGFEGGQMPLHRRLPKRGFTNIFRKEIVIVNLKDLARFPDGSRVGPDELLKAGLIKKVGDGVKVLGNGDLDRSLTVVAHRISKEARRKIEAASGRVEIVSAKREAQGETETQS